MGATRLPGKILKKVSGKTLLEHEVSRVKMSKKISKIIIATTDSRKDDKVENFCRQIKLDCFRGSENDVLDRYYQCVLKYPKYKNLIRITGDCPLIDPRVIDEVINLFEKSACDYVSNVLVETYPDGMDIEVFKRSALELAAKNARMQSEREHVTLYIRNNKKFKKRNLSASNNWSHFRLTVDEPADYEVIKFLIKNSMGDAGFLDYISLLTKNPAVMLKNINITRNEGLLKSLREDKKIC